MKQGLVVALVALATAACGDPETDDNRGYTKAPLEHPTVVIRGEEPGEMSRYGSPNRVVAEVIELPPVDTAAQQGGPDVANVQLPPGVTAEMVTAGQQVFSTTTCFTCHGMNGTGGPLAPALNDAQWLNIDGSYDAIVGVVNNGVPQQKQFPAPMPPKGGATLTDEQVRQVSAYVFSISRQ
jgi:mono/diheme cytochrome c family protein